MFVHGKEVIDLHGRGKIKQLAAAVLTEPERRAMVDVTIPFVLEILLQEVSVADPTKFRDKWSVFVSENT